MTFDEKLIYLRRQSRCSQEALAEDLNVTRQTISKWEQGLRRPDLETVDRIASALSVPSDSIISRRECVIHELQALIPKGAELEPERLSGLLSRFLREQPERDADIFIRKYYMLDPYADIALEHGMRENQVRSRLSKTLRRLGKFIKEEVENDRH